MKVLMLGWEYPPHISGGLGTACEGLSEGLARNSVDVTFVVPRLFGGERAEHMRVLDAFDGTLIDRGRRIHSIGGPSADEGERDLFANARELPPPHLSAYAPLTPSEDYFKLLEYARARGEVDISSLREELLARARTLMEERRSQSRPFQRYGSNIFEEVDRYTAEVLFRAGELDFDVIHAHDWMTFPAGIALKEMTGRPLVAHVHSLEFDRSGEHPHPRINDIERLGVHTADRVIAVSYYTRNIIHQQHSVPQERIAVVHNGVYSRQVVQSYRREHSWARNVVLFLGRITFQKGPDFFVEAAAKVLPHVPDAHFVMAGSGDMLPKLRERVRELRMEKSFYFPGFLRGSEVEELFSVADVYVMPSVSEPFGISALEAISYETPVIISRQSGVAEVLQHALKVDFWDIDRLADLITNALLHPELRSDMASMAKTEVERLHWDASARRTAELYHSLVAA